MPEEKKDNAEYEKRLRAPPAPSEPCPRPDPNKGWNWRSTLPDSVAICSVLAGFTVAFIALLLTGQVGNVQIGVASVTFGQIAILLFGISAGLLVGAEEFFVHAIAFDVYALPAPYLKSYQEIVDKFDENVKTQTNALHKYANIARRCYNVAIILVFIGLFFAIAPYSIWIAILVAGAGLSMELIQYLIISKPVAV